MELETVEEKMGELDRIVEGARGWDFGDLVLDERRTRKEGWVGAILGQSSSFCFSFAATFLIMLVFFPSFRGKKDPFNFIFLLLVPFTTAPLFLFLYPIPTAKHYPSFYACPMYPSLISLPSRQIGVK